MSYISQNGIPERAAISQNGIHKRSVVISSIGIFERDIKGKLRQVGAETEAATLPQLSPMDPGAK